MTTKIKTGRWMALASALVAFLYAIAILFGHYTPPNWFMALAFVLLGLDFLHEFLETV